MILRRYVRGDLRPKAYSQIAVRGFVVVILTWVLGLLLVMGMGVDYGIFLVDSARDERAFSATMLSLLVSCLTTIFVFGTLGLSDQPALRAIGVTTGAGVLLSFLLAPLTFVVAGAHRDDDA